MAMTSLTLARLHVGSLYDLDARGGIARVREPNGVPPPRFHLVRTAEGDIALTADRVPDDVAAELAWFAREEPPLDDPRAPPRHAERYAALLNEHESVVNDPYHGAAFVLPGDAFDPGGAARITDESHALLERHFAWALPLDEAYAPLWVVVAGDTAVSLSFAAREPSPGIEAGVVTAEAYRGRGYARQAVTAWAHDVRASGRTPLYSTWWGNRACCRVAELAGGEMYGVDYSIT